MRTPPAIRLDIRRSRLGGRTVGVLLLLAIVLLASAQLAHPVRLALIAGLIACAGWQWWFLGYGPGRQGPAVRVLAWSSSQGWRLQLAGRTDWLPVELLPGAVVHPWCCGLRFREPAAGRIYDVLLFADSSDAEALRSLRVLWRYELARSP